MKINPEYLVEKNPIFEYLFMPLYFKAIETQQINPLIKDPKAIEIVDSLDYNFDYIEKRNKAAQFHVTVRTKVFDQQVTNQF